MNKYYVQIVAILVIFGFLGYLLAPSIPKGEFHESAIQLVKAVGVIATLIIYGTAESGKEPIKDE